MCHDKEFPGCYQGFGKACLSTFFRISSLSLPATLAYIFSQDPDRQTDRNSENPRNPISNET
jgi:hypothetical protein